MPENYGRVNSEIHSEDGIEQVWRCTWRPQLCELGGRNLASSDMHMEGMIVRNCGPNSTESGDTHGDFVLASVMIHLEAEIVRVWIYTWRQ